MPAKKKDDADKTPADERERREEALARALGQIEQQYGKGVLMRLGGDIRMDVPAIRTGSLGLDLALGVGGVPRGRVIEIFGPEASGKTTLALHILANAQEGGGIAAIVDAEHALDSDYARNLGMNLQDLLVSQPDTGEQALEVTEMLVRSNAVDAIAIDSVAALVPQAEIEGEMGDVQVGLQARLMSKALRKLTAAISKSRTCVMFINQVRMKIGVIYGNPETTPGGLALKFYSSVRIETRRIGQIKAGDVVLGNRTRAKVVKNKVAPPFRTAEFDLIFGQGISREGEVIDLGLANDIIQRSGAWLSYGQLRLGQGRENAKQFLRENKDVMDEVELKVLEKLVSPDEKKK